MKIEIDVEEFAEQVRNGQSVTAKVGVLNHLLKQLTEMTLQAKIESHLAQVVKKNQTHMSDEIEKKMLSLFSLWNSYSQIIDHIEEIYGVHFSKLAITTVTDKLIPMLEEWEKRSLDRIYPFVYLDAIHYKVREDGHYISKAFYTVLGVTVEGKKEILGLYLGENKGALDL